MKRALLTGRDTRGQEALVQHLRTALSGKQEEDPNKALLRALVTQQGTGRRGYQHPQAKHPGQASRQHIHGRVASQPQQAGRR